MTSRDYILERVKKNKPELSLLPNIPSFNRVDVELVSSFKEVLNFVGGRAIELTSDANLNEEILKIYPDMKLICTNVDGLTIGNVDLSQINDPHDLSSMDLVVLKGSFGVAENAAVWIPELHLSHRALPFITQHMAFVVKKSDIVWNMHEAYQRIESANSLAGYGVFISGPSKTADIEQSLVIGAHGSRSLVVFLVN